MNIAIFVDFLSGHLYHDMELYLILFYKLYEKNFFTTNTLMNKTNITFIKINSLMNANSFENPKNFKKIKYYVIYLIVLI